VELTVPSGREGVMIAREDALIVIGNVFDIEPGVELQSVMVIVTLYDPGLLVGVPEITPVDAFIERPVGRPVADHW
jgi:hypothetical protein